MHHPHPQVLTPRACGGRVAHRGLLTSASPSRKTVLAAPAKSPYSQTHMARVSVPRKRAAGKDERPQEPPRSGEKVFARLLQKAAGRWGGAPTRPPQRPKHLPRTRSAGGDSASRSPRDRARCGGPTRREGSPGQEAGCACLPPRARCYRLGFRADRARERGRSRGADSQAACRSTGTFRGRNGNRSPAREGRRPQCAMCPPQARENSPLDCFPVPTAGALTKRKRSGILENRKMGGYAPEAFSRFFRGRAAGLRRAAGRRNWVRGGRPREQKKEGLRLCLPIILRGSCRSWSA